MAKQVRIIDRMGDYTQGVGADTADFMNYVNNTLSESCVVRDTDLKVTEKGSGADMSVDVAVGDAYILNSSWTAGSLDETKFFAVASDAISNVTITANSSGNPRIDIIVATVDKITPPNDEATNVFTVTAVAGTPAGSPTAPATPANSIKLAEIAVANGATSIVNANITDTRKHLSLLMHKGRLILGTTTSAASGDAVIIINTDDYDDIASGDPVMQIVGASNRERLRLESYGGVLSAYEGVSGRGTVSSPTASQDTDRLVALTSKGIDNTGALTGTNGIIGIKAYGNQSTTNSGSYLSIELTPTGSTTRSESLVISVDGSSNVRLVPLGGTLNVTGNVNASNYVIAGYCQTNGFIGSGDKDCSGEFRPLVDNTYSNGSASRRWTAIWAVNGTIQTSDETTKQNIADSDLGLDFINDLRPVSYKMKEAVKKVESEDGEIEYVEKENNEKRTHYGLLADQVKEVLGDQDFAGYIDPSVGGEEGAKGLRYEEFIAPMIKAIQELTARVEELENQE